MKKKGLGKGLDTLIPPSQKESTETNLSGGENPVKISVARIEPNRTQPRKNFDEDALEELADSIRQFGVLEPLLVREKGKQMEIIAGERRWRAAKKAGIKEVPVIIRNDLTDREIVEIQLIENIQRKDLNPIEEAEAYERLINEFNMKQDEVAERVSKSRVTITNTMRLLKLCEQVRQMVIDEMLSPGHARALISIEDNAEQYRIAQRVFDEKLSVRDAEKIVRALDTPEKKRREKKRNENLEAVYRKLEETLKDALGTKVTISGKGDGAGKLEIEFYSGDDLEKIADRLRGRGDGV